MELQRFPNGLTVKELKAIVANLADFDESGNPAEVWIETGKNLSSVVIEVCRLNEADLILCSGAFDVKNGA